MEYVDACLRAGKGGIFMTAHMGSWELLARRIAARSFRPLAPFPSVRRDVAMTGEITLRGKVLPIGGVKEKLLAAHRAGLKEVILPKENEKDLQDIPQDILESIKVNLVETMDEVLQVALERLPAPQGQVSEMSVRPHENIAH